MISNAKIPDSKIAREAAELVQDTRVRDVVQPLGSGLLVRSDEGHPRRF